MFPTINNEGAENRTADAPPAAGPLDGGTVETTNFNSSTPGQGFDAPGQASPPSENTGNGSSSSSSSSATNGAGGQGEGGERSEFIPRARFDEVNRRASELADLAPYADIIGDLRAAGFTDAASVRAALQEQQRAAQQQSAQAEIESLVEQGLVDESLAPVLANLYAQVQQFAPLAKTYEQQQRETQTRARVDAVMGQFPQADREAVEMAIELGRDPAAVAQRTHTGRLQDRAAYNAELARRGALPIPEGNGGGQASAGPQIPNPGTPDFDAYLARVKREAGR